MHIKITMHLSGAEIYDVLFSSHWGVTVQCADVHSCAPPQGIVRAEWCGAVVKLQYCSQNSAHDSSPIPGSRFLGFK